MMRRILLAAVAVALAVPALAGPSRLRQSQIEWEAYEGARFAKFIRVASASTPFYLMPSILAQVSITPPLGGSSGATTALDNLASVAINTSLISDTDNTDDLGSAAKAWRTLYFATSVTANATGAAIQTGTTATDTLVFQAYDNDTGPGYITFATLTAGNTPTLNFPVPFSAGVASTTTAGVTLYNSTNANTVLVQPGATSTSWTWTLPLVDGDANQFMQTDGNGVTTWAAGGGIPLTGDGVLANDDVLACFGTGSDTCLEWAEDFTKPSFALWLETTSKTFLVADIADEATDLVTADAANPTIHIHSSDATTATDWLKLYHDQTGGWVDVGVGDLHLRAPTFVQVYAAGGLEMIRVGGSAAVANVQYGFGSTDTLLYGAGQVVMSFANGDTTPDVYFGEVAGDATAEAAGLHGEPGLGTDKIGGDFSFNGGKGTGTGAPGKPSIRTSVALGTGATLQTLYDRFVVVPGTVTLTESTATAIARIAVATESHVGGQIDWTVLADDGTDFQALSNSCTFNAVNKANAETCTVDCIFTAGNGTEASSSGTLAMEADPTCATAAADTVDFMLDMVSSLTQTTLEAAYTITVNGIDGNDVTPQ